jgi:hypothetical protein
VQTCGVNGQWVSGPACAGATPVCLDGVCVPCAPGTVQCTGQQPQVCNPAGNWQSLGESCDALQINGAAGSCCSGACVQKSNDSNNCGTCGTVCGKDHVCTNSACIISCTAPEVLCNAPPAPDGGTADGGGGTAGDASQSGDAGGADASGDAGDGGSSAPYCANLGNDNFNCGACGNVCLGQHMCNNGVCALTCGPGQQACIAGDVCIAAGTCCSSADCTITGEICPQPGGTCQCPGGDTVCSASNSCIPIASCCTNADCAAVTGETCPAAGGQCACPSGEKVCTNLCINDANCCTNADCLPLPPNTTATSCQNPGASGTCALLSCTSSCYDDDGNYQNGCECCDDNVSKTCDPATNLGTVGIGGNSGGSGVLAGPNESDWFVVQFNGNTDRVNYHPMIQLQSNDPNIVFDTQYGCGNGTCSALLTWEIFYTNGDPNGRTWQPIQPPGDANGNVWIRVYRTNGNANCDPYSLTITNHS